MARKKKIKLKQKKQTRKNLTKSSSLFLCFLVFLFLSVLQVHSSSSIYALEYYADGYFFLKRQLFFVGVSLIAFLLLVRVPLKFFVILGAGVFLVSFIATGLTLVSGFGVKVGGAARWLEVVPSFRIQPGEFFKIGFGFFLFWLLRAKENFKDISFWWPFSFVFLASIGIFFKQPDFGNLVLLSLSSLVALFLVAPLAKPFFIAAFGFVGLLIFLLFQESYRVERLVSFLNPWKDPQGQGFQVIQSFVAFKKGGLLGEGLGMSQSKYFFLPEAHTDFTLAVFAEEFGFVGVCLLSGLFVYTIFKFLKLAKMYQKQPAVMVLGYYLAFLFFLGFFVNFCVNVGLLPTKGLPMPFLSYGGSSLLSHVFLFSFFCLLEKQTKV